MEAGSKRKKQKKMQRKAAGKKRFFKTFPLHVFIFPLYPVLFLFSENTGFVRPLQTVFPLLFSICGAALLFGVIFVFTGDRIKSGIITFLTAVFFFSYGHVFNVFEAAGLSENETIIHIITALTLAAVPVLAGVFVLSDEKKGYAATGIFNFFSVILVSFALIMSIRGVSGYYASLRSNTEKAGGWEAEDYKNKPDIYYILLDGRGRSDILKSIYGYDDSWLTEELVKMGFRLPEKSTSNYAQTILSAASFLNYGYLGEAAKDAGAGEINRFYAKREIKDSRAINFLKKAGYKYYLLPGGYYNRAFMVQADEVLTAGEKTEVNTFRNVFLNTTAFRAVKMFFREQDEPKDYQKHRKNILYNLAKVGDIQDPDYPLFVFAYILAPHPPFVFDSEGEAVEHTKEFSINDGSHRKTVTQEEYVKKYRGQVKFVDKMFIKAVKSIIAGSKKPPVIIIHSDHGPGSRLYWEDLEKTNLKERMSIFSAYYLPGAGDARLPETMSPVNNFRLIFSEYFGKDIDMLENKAYFSKWSRPYDFIDVTKKVR